MNTALINNELELAYPDGFHQMDGDELKKAFGIDNDLWGIWDTENHIIVSVMWHTSNKLLASIASTKGLLERVEKATAKAYAKASYKPIDTFETSACGEKALGFRFAFQMQDVAQTGQVMAFKHGAACYYIHCYERTELMDRSHPLFEQVFSTIKLA